jgi:hypothetical protein
MTMTAIAICVLIGAFFGIRALNVFTTIVAVIFAIVGAAAFEITQHQSTWGVVATAIVIAASIQGGYLASVILAAALPAASFRNSEPNREYAKCHDPRLFDMISNLEGQMEVVGSDGGHVGIIDHKEGPDRIILSKDDPMAGGRPHLIWIDWVDYIDRKVHLNRPVRQATAEWLIA